MAAAQKKNAILVDFNAPDKWIFCDALEEAVGQKWFVEKSVSNENHGNIFQKAVRYVKYFAMPFKVFLHRKDYAFVLAWQQFYGLILAFYFRLFKIKDPPKIVVMTFIYKPKPSHIGKWYERFMRFCVTSDYIQKIVVHSSKECKYYSDLFEVPIEKFSFIKLAVEDETAKIPIQKSEGYYLAAGRSNRDYSFLLSAWDNEFPLKIVCDSLQECTVPSNIEILKDCYEYDYLSLLSKCHAVIIPLADSHASSGQLVILQSMMYGKPVVVTQNDSIENYITNGVNGFVIKKDKQCMRDALQALEENYQEMSVNSRKCYEKEFNPYEEGISLGNILRGANLL